VRRLVRFVPVEARPEEGIGRLRIGHVARLHPNVANSWRRPPLTEAATAGSTWSVKYWNGLEAAHSSPMNSIGTKGDNKTMAAPTFARSIEICWLIRSPAARLPT